MGGGPQLDIGSGAETPAGASAPPEEGFGSPSEENVWASGEPVDRLPRVQTPDVDYNGEHENQVMVDVRDLFGNSGPSEPESGELVDPAPTTDVDSPEEK